MLLPVTLPYFAFTQQADRGRHQAGKPGKEATSEWRGRQANEQKDRWMDVWMAWWIDEWRE
jgi:hypothetical protein